MVKYLQGIISKLFGPSLEERRIQEIEDMKYYIKYWKPQIDADRRDNPGRFPILSKIREYNYVCWALHTLENPNSSKEIGDILHKLEWKDGFASYRGLKERRNLRIRYNCKT